VSIFLAFLREVTLLIFYLDRHERVQAIFSNNGGPESCPYYDDLYKEDLERGATSYEFKIPSNHDRSDVVEEGGYIIRKDLDGELVMFQIVELLEVHDRESYKYIYAESAGLELLNDVFRPIVHMAKNADQILDIVLTDTRWRRGETDYLGVDNFEFKEYQNIFSALLYVKDKLNGELRFRVKMVNGRVTARYVDLVMKRGTDTKKRFVFNKDIQSINRRSNLTSPNVVTALIGVGKGDDKGAYTNFKGIAFSKAAGDPFDKPAGQDWVGDPEALQKHGFQGKHAFGVFQYETSDPEELLRATWKELLQRNKPKVTYELSVALLERLAGLEHEKVRIGDTVHVIDETFSPPLYLEARVRVLETSFTDPSRDVCTLGNFKLIKSNINAHMKSLQARVLLVPDTQNIVQVNTSYNGVKINREEGLTVVNEAGDTVADIDSGNAGYESLNVGEISSPSVLNVNRTNKTITVSENLQQTIDEIADMNNASIVINFADNISEDINIKNFLGDGSISFDLKNFKLNGFLNIQANSGQAITIKNGVVNSDAANVIDVDRSTYVRLENIDIYGKAGTTKRGVSCHSGSHVFCRNVNGWNCDDIFAAEITGMISAQSCGGRGKNYGLAAYNGGFIIADGTIPTGDVANTIQVSGHIAGSYTEPTPPIPPPPPPPPETKKVWEANDSANWGTMYGWENDIVKQGNYGYGRRTGFWFFPNTIATTLAGKTIKSARCYVKRKSSGGSSGKVPIYIHYHGYQDQPTGTPDQDLSGSEEKRIDLAWGEGAWVTLPSSFYNNFANGTAKGLGIYVASDSKANYAIMDSACKLEIIYS
jgi:phage minor structural protein